MNRRIMLALKALSFVAAVALVPACNDDDDDGGAPASGGGGSGGGGSTGGAGSVQFSPGVYTVNEADGSVTLKVVRTGGSAGAATVFWQAGVGTADTSDFHRENDSQPLTWTDGDAGEREIVVPIHQDAANEGSEHFWVFLGSNRGVALGSPNVARVDIVDDESTPGGVFQFGAPVFGVDERASAVTISVHRSGGAAGAVSVEVHTTPDSAATPDDYSVPANPFILAWNDGETGVKTFNVSITPDNAVEGEERFNLSLVNPATQTTTAVGTPGAAVVVISDDDSPGRVDFDAADYAVAETGGSRVITLRRVGGSQGAVSVQVSAVGGTASQGADYTFPPTTVSWADGDMIDKTVSVTVHADGAVEGDETVELGLGSPTGGVTTGSSATLTIFE